MIEKQTTYTCSICKAEYNNEKTAIECSDEHLDYDPMMKLSDFLKLFDQYFPYQTEFPVFKTASKQPFEYFIKDKLIESLKCGRENSE